MTRLLGSPQYGERWGRHWMDIWRYSDWWGLGAEVRNSQKHIWHWRDWIVESVNSDKGYDQMLREMLAADELYPNDLDRLRATGYLARQYFIFNRTTWLDETIEHTAKGMLGLTFNCAKCHDHKYDPLLQAEYYKLRAIFEPYQIRTEMVPGQSDYEKDGIPRAFDAHLDIPTYLHVRGDDRNPDKNRVLEPSMPAFLSLGELKLVIEPVALPLDAAQPGLRDFAVRTHRQAAEQQIAAAHSALDAAKAKLGESEKAATASGAPAKPESLPVEQAQLAVTVAEKALKTAEAQLASVEARAAADRAKSAQAADLSTLALAASRSERFVAANARRRRPPSCGARAAPSLLRQTGQFRYETGGCEGRFGSGKQGDQRDQGSRHAQRSLHAADWCEKGRRKITRIAMRTSRSQPAAAVAVPPLRSGLLTLATRCRRESPSITSGCGTWASRWSPRFLTSVARGRRRHTRNCSIGSPVNLSSTTGA